MMIRWRHHVRAIILLAACALTLGAQQERGVGGSNRSNDGAGWYRTSHALIIGVNTYSGAFPNLSYAEADAKGLATILIENYGFPKENVKVLLGSEATNGRIRQELARLANRRVVQPDDRVLVFFAGHGQTVQTGNGTGEMGFLIPYGAQVAQEDIDNPSAYLESALSMQQVWDYLAPSPARHVLVIADACFSGLLAQQRGSDAPSQATIDENLARRARSIFAAGTKNQHSVEKPNLGHGIFTAKIIEELTARATMPGRVFSAQDLATKIRTQVSNDTDGRQTPQFSSLETVADFLFRPEKAVSTGRPPSEDEKLRPDSLEAKVIEDVIFNDASIGEALDAVAHKGGFEYKLDPAVTGSVTTAYRKVSVRNALKAILDQVDARYHFEGKTCIAEPNKREEVPPAETANDPIIPSVDYDQADIRDALRALFKSVNVNYSIASDVQGVLSLKKRNQRFTYLLNEMLKQVDATYRLEGGVYMIIHKPTAP